MDQPTYLFIGGPLNGQRQYAYGPAWVHHDFEYSDSMSEASEVTAHTYRRSRIGVYDVYVLDSLTVDQCNQHLLDHYQPKRTCDLDEHYLAETAIKWLKFQRPDFEHLRDAAITALEFYLSQHTVKKPTP